MSASALQAQGLRVQFGPHEVLRGIELTVPYGLWTVIVGANGHLFSASFHGNPLLTGGGFGPEASIFTLVLLAIWGVIFSVWLRGVKYPNPAAVLRQPPPSQNVN